MTRLKDNNSNNSNRYANDNSIHLIQIPIKRIIITIIEILITIAIVINSLKLMLSAPFYCLGDAKW